MSRGRRFPEELVPIGYAVVAGFILLLIFFALGVSISQCFA